MNNLMPTLKNSTKQTIWLTIIFILGILFSVYKIFMLPHDLLFYGNVANVSLASSVFMQLSIVVVATFIVGILAISISIQTKKETIVFVERKKEENEIAIENQTQEELLLDIASFESTLDKFNQEELLQKALDKLCELTQAGQGAIYLIQHVGERKELELRFGFALVVAETGSPRFELGEGLIGQVAVSGKSVYLDEVPEGYITIVSGLGTSYPRYLLILPLKSNNSNSVAGVLELATFKPMAEGMRIQLEEMVTLVASKLK